MIVGQSVRVALDSKRRHAARVGVVEYVGDTHARVSFPQDDEHSYWFRIADLDPWPSQPSGHDQAERPSEKSR